MNEHELQQTLQKLGEELPRFPDGRINYSEAGTALVVGIVAVRGNRLLLVKRSQNVSFYPGKWNWLSGFIDEAKPLRDFVEQELEEETGITSDNVHDMRFTSRVEITDEALGKTWLIYPVIVRVSADVEPELDWEAEDFAWVAPGEIDRYETVPGVAGNIHAALREYETG